jgi:SAM-dependent methyltransferase
MAWIYLGLALLSGAALAFEITLTRLFSVTQWYHFAFLAVSVALLGYGASGTALSLIPRWVRQPTQRRASIFAILFTSSVLGAYLSLSHLPFDSYRIAWERRQVLYLFIYYLALTAPFFFSGLVTGMLLAAHARHAARLYAANMVGSAAGGLLPLMVLGSVGEGTVFVIAALGLLAASVFLLPRFDAPSSISQPRALLASQAVLLSAVALLVVLSVALPAPFQLRLSPYKGLSQVLRFPDAELVWQRWNAFSRVDSVESSSIRSAPGLDLAYTGRLPQQGGIFVDGDDLSPVDAGGVRTGYLAHLPLVLPYRLRQDARALVLEPGGGQAVLLALSEGASSVVAVESNPLVVEAAGSVYRDDRLAVVSEGGRHYVRSTDEQFDLIHLALGDAYRPVTSGAYSLGERYDLTVEAFEDYLKRLRPGGLLVIERWMQLPPSELLRAGAIAAEALRRQGVEEPASQLAVLRDWQVGMILVRNGAYSSAELEIIREFSRARSLDLVALPGLAEVEANRFNLLDEPVYYRAFQQLLTDSQAAYATQSYNVVPPTDDQPFFFHFFKWSQTGAVLRQLGRIWLPWGGSGYFVLIALFAVALLTSSVLILLPLAVSRKRAGMLEGPKGRTLAYFGLIGLGFLFVEMPLMQRFILFLDQPVYAFAAVLASILFFSGLGSLAAPRLSLHRTLPLLALAALLYPVVLPLLLGALIGAPLGLRLLVTVISLSPLGFLMGTPFPGGLDWLQQRAPGMVPWAWAVNGYLSVLASILAAMIALSAGFFWVLAAGALAYAGAWLALRQQVRGYESQ